MSLREKLKAHYDDKSMGQERIDKLGAIAAAADRARSRRALRHSLVFAAGLLAFVAAVFMLRSNDVPVRHEVAREIAQNHRHDYASEFTVTDYETLRTSLARLDFVLDAPRRHTRGLTLRGGRYCSLQGRIAAQMRLEDGAGRTCTLYAVRGDSLLDPSEEVVVRLEELRVRLWREGDVLFGLACPRPE